MPRHMHLCAFLMATGHHVASWRHPETPLENGTNFKYWADLAAICERAKLDALFLYDGAAISNIDIDSMSRTDRATFFDPMTLLSALAVVTDRIGLVSTSSTSYDQPYYLARRYLSLDHLSGGRVAWNMVTGVNPREAVNFGSGEVLHATRYARAREFAGVVIRLWDSWSDDAFMMDKQTGQFFDPAGLQAINHVGEHFTCAGPMCVPRSPQGRPVMVQAGGSDAGKDLAAETAEMVYSVQADFEAGREFYADLKGRMPKYGRDPDTLKIMPGIYTIVGSSEQEAEDKYGQLRELVDEKISMSMLATTLGGVDLSIYDPDGPVPQGLTTNAGTTHLKTMTRIAQTRNLSLRELARDVAAGGYGHWAVRGTASQVADQMQERFEGRAADGFNIMPATLPGGLNDFCNLVVPELQRRDLFRTDYTGHTLRDHLGLAVPARQVEDPPKPVL